VKSLWSIVVGVIGFLAYPLLAHTASLLRSATLAAIAVGALAVTMLLVPLRRGAWWAWLLFAAVGAALVWLTRRPDALWLPLYLPPVLIAAFMAWVFGRTLRAGSTPLVLQLVHALHDPEENLAAGVASYARRLTLAWTALFVCLAISSLVLAAIAVPSGILLQLGIRAPVTVAHSTWSLFANVLNYCVIGGFFVLEYLYRRQRFPDQPYKNFAEFLGRLAGAAPRLLAQARRAE
jgi:uncharacterized membrane protein